MIENGEADLVGSFDIEIDATDCELNFEGWTADGRRSASGRLLLVKTDSTQ
jgi:hypothetical protein